MRQSLIHDVLPEEMKTSDYMFQHACFDCRKCFKRPVSVQDPDSNGPSVGDMKMKKYSILVFLIVSAATIAWSEANGPPTAERLAGITTRGKLLAEYDQAARHATDAVLALKPLKGSFRRYIARKKAGRWEVAFGSISDDKSAFLIAYTAQQGSSPEKFIAKKQKKPIGDKGFFLHAAKAIALTLDQFVESESPNRRYNVAVLPAPKEELWIYYTPAATEARFWPIGGDVRYLVDKEGNKILKRRKLHSGILDVPEKSDSVARIRTAVLDNVPEDTDVFHVLWAKPLLPSFIMTKDYLYKIDIDGTITYESVKDLEQKMEKDNEKDVQDKSSVRGKPRR